MSNVAPRRLTASPFPLSNLLQSTCPLRPSASCSDQLFRPWSKPLNQEPPSTHKQPPTPDQVEEKRGEAPPESKSPCRYPVLEKKEKQGQAKTLSCSGARMNAGAGLHSHAMYLEQTNANELDDATPNAPRAMQAVS